MKRIMYYLRLALPVILAIFILGAKPSKVKGQDTEKEKKKSETTHITIVKCDDGDGEMTTISIRKKDGKDGGGTYILKKKSKEKDKKEDKK